MLNGLDLFSGIGGLTLALAGYAGPVAYCENDRYAQAVLLSRMREGAIPYAPIWDDITTLSGSMLPHIDIVYGGFPCQDVSCAGARAGLEGERTGLYREAIRLVRECKPIFVFLENVPGIKKFVPRIRQELEALGYDCRDGFLSAAEVGANHIRNRWWLLAYASGERRQQIPGSASRHETANERGAKKEDYESTGVGKDGADAQSAGCTAGRSGSGEKAQRAESSKRSFFQDSKCNGLEESRNGGISRWPTDSFTNSSWWTTEPDVGRVAHGVPARVDRLRGLGNAVVPQCAREAFKILMGLGNENNKKSELGIKGEP